MALLGLPLSSCYYATIAESVRLRSTAPAVAKQPLPRQSRKRPPRAAVDGTALGEKLETIPTAVPAEVALGRSSFPRGFVFGAASAAYQVEGAWNEGGRGPSIWDTFTHNQPGKIQDGKNGDEATDSYNKYREDVKLMKEMGLDSYRFSISWSRILPKGTLLGGVNPEGINYYNNLINELLKNGIRPFVTLFHWDVPQALEDAYGGFRDHEIVNDFKDFASICFEEFGDRVKHWITLNEPWSFSSMGYTFGRHAPGRCSSWYGCTVGDSSTEPYTVTHNQILAHAEVVKLYKEKFQATQKGELGITLNSMWYEPFSKSHHDKEAANRAIEFMFGWYMDPLVYGDYPFIMRALVRERLPHFTHTQSEMIKGSYDFIGINYYTSRYAQHDPIVQDHSPGSSYEDQYVQQFDSKNGIPIGPLNGSWVNVYPPGMKELLLYTKKRYNNPKIYITENGTAEIDKDLPLEQAREDPHRQDYLAVHFAQVQEAILSRTNFETGCLM